MEASEGVAGPLGEQPASRAEWFQRQRAYPAAEIPPRALKRATRQAHRLELFSANTDSSETALLPPSLDWTSIGPEPIGDEQGNLYAAGRVTALAPVGDGMVTYVGAAQGGVWKTTDAGDHWTPVFDDAIGAGGTGLAIGSLAVDPADSNTVYAGTGEANLSIDSYFGGGIFKSTNAGGAWAKLGGALFDTCYVADLEIRGGVVLASAVRVGRWIRSCVGGVYRSTDGGATWTRTLTDDSDTWSPQIWPNGDPRITTTGAFDVAPGGAGTWFATVHGDDPDHAGGNIFRSTNDGASWTRLAGGLPTTGNGRTEIATAPTDRNRIYAVLSSTRAADYGNLLGLYTSANGGTSWAQLPPPIPESNLCGYGGGSIGVCNKRLSIAVDPSDAGTVYLGSVTAYRSTDYGQTWTWSDWGHADYNAFASDTAGHTWIGNDGGVFRRSTDGSLANLNSDLPITQFEWGIAGEADADGPIFGGTQDTHTVRRRPDGSWRVMVCNDGGAVAWRPSLPDVGYFACSFDLILRTTNDGVTFDADGFADMRAKEDPNEFFNFHPPLVKDPTDTLRLYFASTRVWRTTDGATTWNPISPHFGVDPSFAVQAIGVTTSLDVLYAGTNNGRLELTTNATAGSPTWTETQQNGLPNRIFTEIETMPGDPGTAYVTASGFDPAGGTGHVFKTTDYGAHWSNISANFPNAPANAIEIDWRTSPATLYVATDVGVFWSQNGGATWNNTSTGLPSLMVVDVKLDPVADKLLAATHGRGMYRAPVLSPRTTRTLAVTRSGVGSGTVTSDPPGIDCGSTCEYEFGLGTVVTLTATPAEGSLFSGWGGACSGTGTCQLTMSGDQSVTANFALAPKTLTVSKTGAGTGTVTSDPAGIDCGPICTHAFEHGTSVTLTAAPADGSVFTGWSGACSGTGTCQLTMSADHSVTANFALAPKTLTVSKTGAGTGTVTSSPAGIDCGPTCTHAFAHGTSVTLTATPAAGSVFTGWGGACSGTGTCQLTMSADHSVTADFALAPKTLTVSKAGAGNGTVTSSPAGINCGPTCTHVFEHGTSVTLTATAHTGATFTGWSGACSGTGTCTLTMSEERSATATFALLSFALSVDKTGSGAGTISSSPAGIDCGPTCAHDFLYGTEVTLTALPAVGSSFAGWTSGCSGTGPCMLTMTGPRSATAVFNANASPPAARRCVVPRLTRRTLAAAKRLIRAARCSVGSIRRAYSAKRKGTVISQRPAPGTRLASGGRVKLVVSRGKKKR